eukprot:Plantae.Rhodophyta-Rhodochaete_pulchella.ctg11204.p1 GENE.Plantae.Rhodophyta-Rhodochaete_pulchella.ctg11204~~Plantae.Rhodophyta-Rhodochaete_pulchella.ctg11204.p1  ORF type:complete len:543 (-),score=113.67 Plantae.Rhodophyta-Rhodochaete_pulchella.ctg11204:99-1511(-)
MIELSKTQDEEVGDGTTSVTVIAGELLALAEPFLQRNIHPTVIVNGFFRALEDAVSAAESFAVPINAADNAEVEKVVMSCIATKFVTRYQDLMVRMAMDAIRTVSVDVHGKPHIDIKNYARVEKIPGGEITDSRVLKGVMFNKDVCSANMRRRIENPRIVLLDTPLEFKKGESQTNVELVKDTDWQKLLELEEQEVQRMCDDVIALKPDVVITEKGISDLALHFLGKAGISAIRRLRKTDNNRVARATGATIVSRTDELKEGDVGTGAGLFEIRKIGDEYFTFVVECKNPKACTVLLRGGSKDVLNEVERNLQDALCVAKNVMLSPKLVPGGGAIEMAVSAALMTKSKSIEGVAQWPYRAVAEALEVIPRTLAENCGSNIVRLLTQLRAKHAGGENRTWGIDGNKGTLANMEELGVWEPLIVKTQTMKTAIEAAAMLLRIDDIVSGISKKKDASGQGAQAQGDDDDNGLD